MMGSINKNEVFMTPEEKTIKVYGQRVI